MLVWINVSECCSEHRTSNWSDFYFLPFIDGNESGFCLTVFLLNFPTSMPTQVAFIFMFLSPVWSTERRRGGQGYLFFPPLFLHLSPLFSVNKNTLNPFWDMLRIRSNRLFFFLSPPSRVTSECVFFLLSLSLPIFIFSLSLSFTHMHFRLYTHTHAHAHWCQCVRISM